MKTFCLYCCSCFCLARIPILNRRCELKVNFRNVKSFRSGEFLGGAMENKEFVLGFFVKVRERQKVGCLLFFTLK